MALNTSGIATAIAALSVTGVTIKDLDAIPINVDTRAGPVMYPEPAGWIDGYSFAPGTMGTSTAFWSGTRTLLYNYCHIEISAGRLFDYHVTMSQKADLIVEALAEMDVPGVDVRAVQISRFGPVVDPSGAQFHGFSVAVVVWEMLNA